MPHSSAAPAVSTMVVIGSSLAGSSVATALSPYLERVVVLERDGLTDEAISEERLQSRGKCGHASPPRWRSSRSPASPSNSGAADRYQ